MTTDADRWHIPKRLALVLIVYTAEFVNVCCAAWLGVSVPIDRMESLSWLALTAIGCDTVRPAGRPWGVGAVVGRIMTARKGYSGPEPSPSAAPTMEEVKQLIASNLDRAGERHDRPPPRESGTPVARRSDAPPADEPGRSRPL